MLGYSDLGLGYRVKSPNFEHLFQDRVCLGFRLTAKMRLSSGRILVLLLISLISIPDLSAQSLRPRLGFGLSLVPGTTDQTLGIGINTRFAWVVNADVSFAASINFNNYILKGREEAAYFVHPTASAIITLDASNLRSPYLIFGIGGNIPLGGEASSNDSGPSLHAGTGWVFSLQATSLYLEIIPALIIAQSAVEVQLPVRFGVIL